MVRRIGIEGSPIFGQPTGVGQYALRLTEAASKNTVGNKFEIIRFWLPFKKLHLPVPVNHNLSYRFIKWFPPAVYFQVFKRLGWAPPYDWFAMRRYSAVVFYNFVAFPLRRNTKSVVVVHDLSYIHHKQYVSPKNQAYLEKFVPRSIKLADKIIAVSENTKREIMSYYKVAKKNIVVINPSVDHEMFRPRPVSEIKRVMSKYKITKPYILSVATQEPRKNLIGVLNAFDKLPESLKQKYALVLVGGKGWLDGELTAKYEALSKKYEIIRTGYVESEDLPLLYSGTRVFVYPSFYEGFGIPPLEAMACGAPVITSDNSSLPEVVGDAAIKIQADDGEALRKSLEQILTNDQMVIELSQKSLKQAARFSWDLSADKLIKLLEAL